MFVLWVVQETGGASRSLPPLLPRASTRATIRTSVGRERMTFCGESEIAGGGDVNARSLFPTKPGPAGPAGCRAVSTRMLTLIERGGWAGK